MNIKSTAKWLGLIPCMISLMLSSGTASTAADSARQVSVQLSLDTNTFSQGEPIIVPYKIINSGTTRIYSTVLQKNREKWFNVEVKDEIGNIVPSAQPLPPAYKAAFTDREVISAGTSYDASLVLSQWIAPLQPGKYTVLIQAEVLYTANRDGSDQVSVAKQVSFPITVTHLDANRLRTKAIAAQRVIETNADAMKQESALKMLLALPEASALPQWQSLVSDPNLSDNTRERIAEELSHMASTTAVDLMAQLCWGDEGQKHAGVPMMVYLSGMWQAGDQAMKKYIEKVAAAHGDPVPFVPLVRLD